MRRKSERTATKKAKPSPEKKVEKVKRTRSKRKKQSTSSDNDSADEVSPAQVEVVAKVEEPPKPPKTPVKEDSPEEAQDQVWQVKAAEGSRDTGEIQKLKICLTRPPSTPERAERSPRSKRKFSRATSSSDATSVEASEEKDKKKTRRSKRSHRESNDELDKSHDSQGEEPVEEVTQSEAQSKEKSVVESSENTITTSDENVESKSKNDKVECSEDVSVKAVSEDKESKQSDADTTVVSPQVETTTVPAADPQPSTPLEQTKPEPEKDSKESQNDSQENKNDTQESPKDAQDSKTESQESKNDNQESQNESKDSQNESKDSQNDSGDSQNETQESHNDKTEKASPERRRSMSVDKSEILELHPEESKCESDIEADKSKTEDTKEETVTSVAKQVSKFEEKAPNKESDTFNDKHTNVTGIVESSDSDKKQINHDTKDDATESNKQPEDNQNKLERSDSTQSHQDESLPNGQAAPIVVSRKRRWGSRPKITTQKIITISTDLLKGIIPDVKPVEFDEVLEEKKHKREVTEKIERPVLPKIVIDNTENVDRNHDVRKEQEDKDRHVIKPKESHLAVNRKISIINDNDTVIKPPSPPRHKQSSVLYITNLVRPFTLPQLKNLLQRTGKIVENGFWIDKIKSKCYVVYEKEDQAIETRHALHGVTWPVSNPKTLQVDFSTQEAFEKAKNEETDNVPVSTMGGTVEDWLREQDQKRQRGELEKPWERKSTREWDLGKNENDKEKEKRRDEKPPEKRRHRSIERSPEPARKFKKKEEEAPAKLLDDLFKKTKTTPCIYWLPLSAETIAIKEEQRRQHMAEHERRMLEQRRPHRRH